MTTKKVGRPPQPIDIPGYGKFPSIKIAAKAIGCSWKTIAAHKHKGTLHRLGSKTRAQPIHIPGHGDFPSITAGAKHLGITVGTLAKLNRTGRLEYAGKGPEFANSQPVTIRWTKYKSKQAAADDLGVCVQTINNALAFKDKRRGTDLVGLRNRDGTKKVRGLLVKCHNTIYPSIADFCRQTGKSYDCVHRHLENCIPLEEIFNKRRHAIGRRVMFYNREWPSITLLAKCLGVHPHTVSKHIETNTLTSLVDDDERWNYYLNNLRNLDWKNTVDRPWERL